MTQKHYFVNHDREFMREFTVVDAEIIRVESSIEDPTVTGTDAHVYQVKSDPHSAFFVNIAPEDNVSIQSNRVSDLLDCYKAAIRLGVSVPTPLFGSEWWVMKEFEGERPADLPKPRLQQAIRNLDRERWGWDLAKLILLGYRDCGPQNHLIRPDGEYRFVDMQALNTRIMNPERGEGPDLFVSSLGQMLMYMNLDPGLEPEIERKCVALACYLEETPVIKEYLSPVVSNNIHAASEAFPTYRGRKYREEELPTVDESVIPRAEEVNPVLAACEADSPDLFPDFLNSM